MHSADRILRPLLPFALAALLWLCGCASQPSSVTERSAAAPAPRERQAWIDAALKRLTLEEKIGQMIMSKAYGYYYSAESDEYRRLEHVVRDHKFGGLIMMQGEVYEAAALLNRLQALSDIPLLVGSDFEWGAAMRIRRSTRFPEAMALAATRDTALAFRMGEALARESRAIGVHQVFAPVADVNINPANPVINIRSFGESPALVAAMASAVAAGLRSGGALATAKHFPGHGDTDVDSHLELPRISASRARLDSVELVPFRALVRGRIGAVMIAHLEVPAVEGGQALPSTLSRPVVEGLLRTELGFDGIVITDAMDMGALVKNFGSDSAAVRAVEAGVDILLILPDEDGAVAAIAQAVRTGRIPESRIERSVRKVLGVKWDLGLVRERRVAIDSIPSVVGTPEHLLLAREIARNSITVLKNDGVLPLERSTQRRMLAIVASDAENYRTEIHRPTSPWPNEVAGDYFVSLVRKRHGGPVETVRLDPTSNALDFELLRKKVLAADVVLCPVFSKARSGTGILGLPPAVAKFLDSLPSFGTPVVLVSLGSPYAAAAIPGAEAALCAYSDAEPSTEAVVEALYGEIPARGRLPVTIPGLYPFGAGIEVRQSLLRHDAPASAGFDADSLALLDSVMARAIRDSAFPGAQLLVARDGAVVYQKAFGGFTYGPESPRVTGATMYDLASMTKVIATTSVIMRLYDESRLKLDDRVTEYLPEFGNHGKEQITIRNLLVHNAGLPPFKRLYLTVKSPEEALDSVYQTEMIYPTGDSTVYSDFDFILLGKIAERITGVRLDWLADSLFFKPLGMTRTQFTPDSLLWPSIAPTEFDSVVRKALVQGTVHDENAYVLGGVSGHAGLFSTAGDLAVFMAMIMNDGSYGGKQYLRPETVRFFTTRQRSSSSRALGWDTKSEKGYSSAGALFGPRTFGHTGFTGTSVWADPERKIFVILLTNRVYPTRNNRKIGDIRPIVHDTVIRALHP
jgi:beta-glucosidase-like glycosyl hydrolase/CubicO group peptidase (beta-lactamase class C family)